MRNLLSLLVLAILVFAIGCSASTSTGKSEDSSKAADSSAKSDEKKAAKPGPDGKTELSMEKFMKLEMGMSYDQVKEIMSVEGEKLPGNSYAWHGENSARINANFQDDKLSSKFQSSIIPSKGTAELSIEKFNKLKSGVSYEEVVKIIGAKGELVSMRKIGDVIETEYRWEGQDYDLIKADFADGKVKSLSNSNLK